MMLLDRAVDARDITACAVDHLERPRRVVVPMASIDGTRECNASARGGQRDLRRGTQESIALEQEPVAAIPDRHDSEGVSLVLPIVLYGDVRDSTLIVRPTDAEDTACNAHAQAL